MRKKIKVLILSLSILAVSSISITFGILISINSPSTRYGSGMVYDDSVDKLILFGGGFQDSSSYTYYGDTWMYDPIPNLWSEIFPQHHPTARSSSSMVYDPVNQKIVLFGGVDITDTWMDDTWIFDSRSQEWTQVFPNSHPSARGSASIFYDPQAQKVILYGGFRYGGGHFSDTWAFDYSTNNWTNLNPPMKPTGRYGAPMVYDPVNQRGFMFGGRISGITDETWVYYYPNNSWVELIMLTKPPDRYWEPLTYDDTAQRIILFGGSDGSGNGLDDTWTYNPFTNQWTQELSSSPPVNRLFSSFVNIPGTGKSILFGGSSDANTCLGDTWSYIYSSNNWNKLK